VIYLLTILFNLCFILYSKFQFEERVGKSHGKWHPWGWMMRALIFIPFIILSFFPGINITAHKSDVILSIAISTVDWEVLINLIALKVNFFHVGTEAKTDIRLGKIKWLLCFLFLILAIIYKIWLS
jgi:hypothetical protein